MVNEQKFRKKSVCTFKKTSKCYKWCKVTAYGWTEINKPLKTHVRSAEGDLHMKNNEQSFFPLKLPLSFYGVIFIWTWTYIQSILKWIIWPLADFPANLDDVFVICENVLAVSAETAALPAAAAQRGVCELHQGKNKWTELEGISHCVVNSPAPEGAVIHPGSRRLGKMCVQITLSARQTPEAMLTTYSVIVQLTPPQIIQHPVTVTRKQNQPPRWVITDRSSFHADSMTQLLIYSVGSCESGSNEDIISYIHDRVACTDSIMTNK